MKRGSRPSQGMSQGDSTGGALIVMRHMLYLPRTASP